MLSKRDIGRWVRIRFWDHCIIPKTHGKKKKEPVFAEVAGMIREVNNEKITLTNWWLPKEDKETQAINQETTVIVRSCIIEYGWAEILKWNRD